MWIYPHIKIGWFMIKRVLFLTILLLIFNGCASNNVSAFDEAKEHMIESEKLRSLMLELDMVVYDRLKSELDKDNIRRRYAMRLADSVKDIAIKIENISPKDLWKKIDQDDVKLFKLFSKQLYSHGIEIDEVAKSYELEKLSNKLDNMQRTCNSCHSHFRD